MFAEVELDTPILRNRLTTRPADEPVRRLAAGPSVVGSGPFAALELAARRARNERTLEAAAEAVRAAEILAGYEGGRYRQLAELEAMRLRTEFVVQFGSRPGHPMLDKEIILRWFLEELPSPAAVTRTLAAQMDDLAADELRTLRLLKSRLALVEQLAGCGELPASLAWQEWRQLDGLLS